ncbi:MAG: hypothetical protein APF81_25230 [Desulfosporosinus sp. BRH_c37]|nr:MAG: hypothetical protein APF81_25230 [Desulfosporosinus sp. BRH_c37]
MKKTKKAIAALAIAGMALSIVPFNAFAAVVPPRLAGTTAAQTAVAIAEQTGWTGTAILASTASYGMVDALTAGPLSFYLKAPILLTDPGSTLDADTKAELTKLAVKTVYVTSGTAVISQAVLDQITGMGITVVPLGGADRAGTSVNIAKKMTGVTKVAVVNGLQDALSIAAIASAANEPILFTDKETVPASILDHLAANPSIIVSDIIGGTGVISDAVKAKFPGATRHSGTSAYDTNNQVIQDFAAALTFGNVFVANGITGIDALAGAPLAAITKSAIILTNGTVPAAATFVHSKLAADSVVTALGGAAVVPANVLTRVTSGEVTAPTGALSVTSVSATGAATFKVVFNQAPTDTAKIVFTVKNLTNPVTVNPTWNTAKTEAVLTNSANFPEGTYTVAVKNDATDLGTTSVVVAQQKITSITIPSTKLGVVTDSSDSTKQTGYATYKVLDQYGNDITSSSLANSLTFQSGVGTVTAKDGLLTLASSVTNLMQFATVVLTGYDSTTGVSVSATLTTSTQIGTLSDFQLGTLTNADEKVLTGGDSSIFYACYTATDISGNPTTNYDLIKGGLILHSDNAGNTNLLTSSNSYVTATVEKDPSDSSKAVIKVVASNSDTALTIDIPTVITAMTWTGKTSSLNTTLKKASQVDTFTLMSPTDSIAVNEGKVIPFTALDQNGAAITKYIDLKGTNVTISNAKLIQNTNGTASLIAGPNGNGFTNDGQQVITATTSTGKCSSLTINIQKLAKATTLSLDTTQLVTTMQNASNQVIDYGINFSGLSVKDQYDRAFDMITYCTSTTYNYKIIATTASTALTLTGTDQWGNPDTSIPIASGANGINIKATAPAGSAASGTVTFKLVNILDGHAGTLADPYTVIDSKSVTISIVKDSDITEYTLTAIPKPIYAINNNSTLSQRAIDYAATSKVYGKTSSGEKVLLAGKPIIGISVDSTDFTIAFVATPNSPLPYKKAKVVGNTLGPNVTSSSTNLAVTIKGADGLIYSLTTPIKSSTATPLASKIFATVSTYLQGVTLNETKDVATVSATFLQPNMLLAKYNINGARGTYGPNNNGLNTNQNNISQAGVYFRAMDQYTSATSAPMQLSEIIYSAVNAAGGTSTFTMKSDGTILTAPTAGDVITLTGVTSNGLLLTMQIHVTAALP